MILVVRRGATWESVGELVAYAKANPGRLNRGSAGAGNLTHLSGELLKVKARIDFVSVQYKSSAEFNTALLGGQVDLVVDNVAGLRGADPGRKAARAGGLQRRAAAGLP